MISRDVELSANKFYQTASSIAQSGVFICGGGIRDLYINVEPKDLDVFVPEEKTNEWFRYFRSMGFKQVRRNFYKDGIVLDVVSTYEKSAIDIINKFDCDICRWYMTDKPTPLNENVRIATDSRMATFDLNLDLFGTSFRRADKLVYKGWAVKFINY